MAYADNGNAVQHERKLTKAIFTEKELEYLSGIDFVPICVDPNWLPYEKVDEKGRYTGLVADYIKTISQKIGKEFRVIKTKSWPESLSVAHQRGCDILPGAVPTPSRKEYLSFTSPYIFIPLVVATHIDDLFIVDFAHVADKTFAIIEGYAAIEILRKKYPEAVIQEVNDAKTGLEMVQDNKVYGYIDTLPTISYQMQKERMSDVKISGELDFEYNISIAVRNDRPLLLSILNKGIASISHEERQKFFYEWISVKYEKGFNYALLWKILTAFFILISLFLYRYLVISKYNKKLTEANDKLDVLYKTDKLTGIFNRNKLDKEIEKEILRTKRYNTSFSCVLIDIDHFKHINDAFGHYTGDCVLTEIASILKNHSRNTDIVGRWGGEEFLILCPETDLVRSAQLAEILRSIIEQYEFPQVNKVITASFGVATCTERDTSESLIKRVDVALYASKGKNRNCVTTE